MNKLYTLVAKKGLSFLVKYDTLAPIKTTQIS